jgi:hypothetical protein
MFRVYSWASEIFDSTVTYMYCQCNARTTISLASSLLCVVLSVIALEIHLPSTWVPADEDVDEGSDTHRR